MDEPQTYSAYLASIGSDVDKRVQNLVDVLNSLPGVETNSSCGGHEKQEIVCQLPKEEFYVDISFEERKAGWKAIERIVDAIWAIGLHNDVKLNPWVDGGLRWDLHGYNNADPDELANAILEGLAVDDIYDDDEE